MTEHRRPSGSSFFHCARARMRRRLEPVSAVAALFAGWVMLAPAAHADGDVLVSVPGATDTRVVVTSARGARQVETDADRDGVVSVRPNAGAGSYEIEITANGVTEKTSIEVPQVELNGSGVEMGPLGAGGQLRDLTLVDGLLDLGNGLVELELVLAPFRERDRARTLLADLGHLLELGLGDLFSLLGHFQLGLVGGLGQRGVELALGDPLLGQGFAVVDSG